MKKLSVLFLATVFVFGLVVQAGAQEQGPHVVLKDAFTVEDPVITFDDFASAYDCSPGEIREPINFQYEQEFGVSFSGSLYGERFWTGYFGLELAASNFNICEFDATPGEPVVVEFNPPVTRVGFIGISPAGGITVTPFRDGFATADPIFFNTPGGADTFIGIEDSAGIDEIKIEGNGIVSGKASIFWIDDFTFGGTLDTGPTEIEVTMNVNPPSCSGASINVKSKGVTPVVIAGSEDFDVTMIDPASILLHGVAPVRSAIEDVPYCNNSGSDGYWDLALKFDTKELVDAMEATAGTKGETLENYDWPVLHLTGSLFDGTTIYADEPVSVKGKPVKENTVKGDSQSFDPHSRHDRGHHKGWHNNRGHHKGLHKNR